MQSIQRWFSGQEAEPSASVLAEWNAYSTSGTTTSSQSAQQQQQSARLLASAEEGASAVGKMISSSFTAVTGAASGAAASASSGLSSLSMPSGTQLVYFGAILGSGVLFLLLAIFVFLPVLIIAPSKFALTFSLGSGLVLASIGALRGWKQQAQHMISRERLPFTAAYLGSLAGTIYAALVMHSYVFSLLCCAVQVVALLYYLLSYFPGGSNGAQFMLGMAGRMFGQACGACTRFLFSK